MCNRIIYVFDSVFIWTVSLLVKERMDLTLIIYIFHTFRYMFFFQMPYLPEFFLQHDCCSSLNAMFRDMDKKPLKNCTEEDIEAYKYTFSKKGLLHQYK